MQNFNFYKNLFNLFTLSYFFVSAFLSLNVGLTHDESHHNLVWEVNRKIYSNYLFKTNYEISFPSYGANFYGIGFQIFSYPFENILKYFFSFFSIEYNYLTLKHPSIVLLFVISGIYFKKILNILITDKRYVYLSVIFYFFYPYLLGHSFFNTLDIPFMSVWLICSYYLFKIIKNFLKKNNFYYRHFIILSFTTAYLLSIRISGILIFIQYFFLILLTINNLEINFFDLIKIIYKKILVFVIFLFFIFYILHPNYWNNLFLVIDSIKYMGNHIQTVCTLTLGECMKAQELPSSYIPIWLLFKLPLIILFGLAIFPFVEKKIFENKLHSIIVGTLILSILSIIVSLILINANLYDELRQLLFLFPMILIVSILSIFRFNKKISFITLTIFSIFFLLQNLKVYPYNYIWINNLSHITGVKSVFELDYWGVSNKRISNYLSSNNYKGECIISNTSDRLDIFLKTKKKCFKNLQYLHKNNQRPFYVVLTERALNKGTPNRCENLYNESVNLNFSSEELLTAKIFKCN